MTLFSWEEPARLLSTLFDAPAATTGTPFAANAARRWVPAMDLVENGDHYLLTADLPGLSSDDVAIEVEDHVLTVSGERTHATENREGRYLRVERASGSFRRSLTLPEGIDADGIGAAFDNGVLQITIPKPEQRKPRRVEIAVGGDAPKTIDAEAS
ncbi:Hsp20/alpha crystallin family protein [Paraconexibacter sp.]|uniref:Hsp20/alpha crystallin family protein n=1 Tax=Paraconexibacter sp. TaxID=2949640 RepID=UPI00356A0BCD